MPFAAASRDIAEYAKREVLPEGVIRYSNRNRRYGMLIMLGVGAAFLTAMWFHGPWQPALLFTITFLPLWTPFWIAHGWTMRTMTLKSEGRLIEFRANPMIGKPEVGSYVGERISGVSLEKEEKSWVVRVHRFADKSHFIDSSEDRDQVERIASDMAGALGVPLNTGIHMRAGGVH